MITFITNRKHNVERIQTVSSTAKLIAYLDKLDCIGIDVEATGLNPYNAILLMVAIGDSENQWVIDTTSVDISFMSRFKDKLFLGHNIKYDLKMLTVNGFKFKNIYDTMIVERLLGLGARRDNSLLGTYRRRLKKDMPEDKSTRNQFTSMNAHSTFTDRQIRYNAGDIEGLFGIKTIQKSYIEKFEMEHLIFDIHFKILPIIADAELKGINLDEDKWKDLIISNKSNRLSYAIKMDTIIKALGKGNPSLTGGKYNRDRKVQEVIQKSMFGIEERTTSNKNKANTNYSSPQQVLELFRHLKQPLPYIWETTLGKRNKKQSIKEEALDRYLIEYPKTIMKQLIRDLLHYKEYEKAISSFGERFLYSFLRGESGKSVKGYKEVATGNIHTNYKQALTDNDRLASGDSKSGYFNSQNIKKLNSYRNCFTLSQEDIDAGYYMTTCDLSGAELIILGSLSSDKKLIELQSSDIHSHLASAAYTSIIKYIMDNMKPERQYRELYELLQVNKIQDTIEKLNEEEKDRITKERIKHALQYGSIKIGKKETKDIRDPFKNVVYGVAYGASESKIGETLNMPIKYAELTLNSMKKELPTTFEYLDEASKFGVKHAYIKFNTRTNSRHWFKYALEARQGGFRLNRTKMGEIERACKNYPISGTQSNMILESMSVIDAWMEDNRPDADCQFLLQIHDELVYKHRDKNLGADISRLMTDTANKYLNGIKMGADYSTLTYWNK